jgi:hypothetical protein
LGLVLDLSLSTLQSVKTLEIRYPSPAAFAEDLATNVHKGRAFVTGASDVASRELCELLIVHPLRGDEFRVGAEAVWVDPSGVGLDLIGLDEAKKAELVAFETGQAALETDASEPDAQLQNVYLRIRQLSLQERDQVARHGPISERVALERAFGSSVWEGLLQNPMMTPPEVARIAKMGTLSKPLVNVIVNHAAWVAIPEVQRALLSNPRCAGSDLDKVLRSLKPTDLAKVAKQSPYRGEVRSAAQRLVGK